MQIIENILYITLIISAIGMVTLILLQHGKGADMGTSFGSGTSQSLFGATGGANVLSRTTAIFALFFFVSVFGFTVLREYQGRHQGSVQDAGVLEKIPPPGTLPDSGATPKEPIPEVGKDAGSEKAKNIPK
ncbi:MAG: preprotein translocase subunit SecG [Gammaproteobacteria bacterium]|nr:preprotein translocase subunit SecG [Gammaproteobacteria bacterium]